jgi:hypothetical protein
MSRRSSRGLDRLAYAAACLGLLLAPFQVLEAQDSGSVAGVVIDDSSGRPIGNATVSLVGLGLRTTTAENGQFLFDGVPLGAVDMRFEVAGYMSLVEELELSATDFLQVRLYPVRAVLDGILVTAGREPRRTQDHEIRVGDDVEAWRSVLNLLEDQVPGVVVRRGGSLGGGAYLYIRGAGSFQRDNAPDVYLDGLRLNGGNTDNRSLHILDMISAEEVERVRVLKGAAGASGSTAGGANGVILIETRRGGPPAEPN